MQDRIWLIPKLVLYKVAVVEYGSCGGCHCLQAWPCFVNGSAAAINGVMPVHETTQSGNTTACRRVPHPWDAGCPTGMLEAQQVLIQFLYAQGPCMTAVIAKWKKGWTAWLHLSCYGPAAQVICTSDRASKMAGNQGMNLGYCCCISHDRTRVRGGLATYPACSSCSCLRRRSPAVAATAICELYGSCS
jgi:hypothetical protein